tara:strand:+ start:51 stop:452 length:402 start_codon:yes stop_codon:yes gene_type:complete
MVLLEVKDLMKRNKKRPPSGLTWCQIVGITAIEGGLQFMGNDDKRVNLRMTQGMWQEIVEMQEWMKLRTTAECVRLLLAQALEAHKLRANTTHQTNVLESMRDIQGAMLEEAVNETVKNMGGGISNTPTGEQN